LRNLRIVRQCEDWGLLKYDAVYFRVQGRIASWFFLAYLLVLFMLQRFSEKRWHYDNNCNVHKNLYSSYSALLKRSIVIFTWTSWGKPQKLSARICSVPLTQFHFFFFLHGRKILR